MSVGLYASRIKILEGDGFTRVDIPPARGVQKIALALLFALVWGQLGWFLLGVLFNFGPFVGQATMGARVASLAGLVVWVVGTVYGASALVWSFAGRETLWVAPGKFARTVSVLGLTMEDIYDAKALETMRFVPEYSTGAGRYRTYKEAHLSFKHRGKFLQLGNGISHSEAQAVLETLRDVSGVEAREGGAI